MNVLHVIPALAARYGGPSAALPALCAALGEAGIETAIATTDADGSGHLPVDRGVATTYKGTATFFFTRQFSESLKYSRPLAVWLDRHVRTFAVVHVHAVFSHACLAAGRACRRSGVPYVVRPLGTLDPWSLGQKAAKKRLLLWAAGRRLLRNATAIQYTSRREMDEVEASLGVTRGVVIPLGTDAITPSRRRATDPYVLALSRLHPVKGLDTLVDAFARASSGKELLRWRLVIAGDGEAEYVESLKTRAARSGAGERIRFAGWVEGAAKRALLEGASLFALPSLHESFGVSLIEALAHGVPALVSPHVHLAAEIQESRAGWVAGPEREEYKEALEATMRSDDERERRGEAAWRFAQRFAWPRVAEQLVELYGEITSRPDARPQTLDPKP